MRQVVAGAKGQNTLLCPLTLTPFLFPLVGGRFADNNAGP